MVKEENKMIDQKIEMVKCNLTNLTDSRMPSRSLPLSPVNKSYPTSPFRKTHTSGFPSVC